MSSYYQVGIIRNYRKKGRVLFFERSDPNYPPQDHNTDDEKKSILSTVITMTELTHLPRQLTTEDNLTTALIEFLNRAARENFYGGLTRIVEFSLKDEKENRNYSLPTIPTTLADNIPDYNSLLENLEQAIRLLENLTKRCGHLEVRLSSLSQIREMLRRVVVEKMSLEEVAAEFKITPASCRQRILTFLRRFACHTKWGADISRMKYCPYCDGEHLRKMRT